MQRSASAIAQRLIPATQRRIPAQKTIVLDKQQRRHASSTLNRITLSQQRHPLRVLRDSKELRCDNSGSHRPDGRNVRWASTLSSQKKACIKCDATLALNELSCPSCGTLQPLPSELNAFELLDIDQSKLANKGWGVDLGELKAVWRKKMALTHPDRMGGKDDVEQQIAAQQSAMLNRAYETLREPLQRVHLLLEQFDQSVPSESESVEDPALLMEVMEVREELEEASHEAQVDRIRQENRRRLDETQSEIQNAFAQNPPDVETARRAAIRLRYWTNIDKAAREWELGKQIELQH